MLHFSILVYTDDHLVQAQNPVSFLLFAAGANVMRGVADEARELKAMRLVGDIGIVEVAHLGRAKIDAIFEVIYTAFLALLDTQQHVVE